MGLLLQRGLQVDFGLEEFGDRTVEFSVFGQFIELLLGNVWHPDIGCQVRGDDGALIKDNFAFRPDFFRRKACALQVKGKFHGETAGVRGGHQFFRISPSAAFKAGEVAVLGLVKYTALR